MKKLLALVFVTAATLVVSAQGVHRDLLHKPLADSWPTYSGDYSGKRYSALTQINQRNVKTLTLAWTRRLVAGPGPSGPVPPDDPPVITGGEGDVVFGGATIVKGAVLSINGVLYVTAPDNVWALDANDGHLLVAVLLEDKGRHAHRQSRRRHLGQLPVLRDARQLPRLARREDGQGALAQGNRQLSAAVLLTPWRLS